MKSSFAMAMKLVRRTNMFSKHQPEPTRWRRSVRQLGNTAAEKALQEELETLYPEGLYPFHIDVCGASDTTHVSICVWRPQPFMDVSTAIPEDFGGDSRDAILQRVVDLVADFRPER
jgi:hypothetical protein